MDLFNIFCRRLQLMQDFTFLYPEKENFLFVNWKQFQAKLIAFAKKEATDEQGKSCLQQLAGGNLSEGNIFFFN
jgi:hypothetical protein